MANLQLPYQRIRFAADISQWNAKLNSAPIDVITGAAISIANGADLQLEMMFSDGALSDSPSTVVDFTNIASVVISLQSSTNPHNATTYWTVSVENASIDNTVTAAQWNEPQGNPLNETAQILVEVGNALNSFNLTNNPNATYWLCIYGITTDATPKQVPYAFFPVTIVDTGMPVPVPVLGTGFKVGSPLNFICSDAQTRSVTLQKSSNGTWTVNVNQVGFNGPGQAVYSMFCAADGLYRDLSLVLLGGVWTLNINQTGHS